MKWSKIASLFLYVVVACGGVFVFRPTYLLSICIVLVPPALVNFFWLKRERKKVLIFSLLATFLFAPPVELMARLTNAWDVQSVLWRPLGLIPLENMLFAFLNFLWGLSFYEYFVDRDRSRRFSRRFTFIMILFVVFASLIFGLFVYDRALVSLSYAWLAVPTLIIPAVLIFGRNPRLLPKTIVPTLFFAGVFALYELISLLIGSWWWPGEYLLPMHIFGHMFPLDDVLIWYLLSTPVLIGGYEFFVDDDK